MTTPPVVFVVDDGPSVRSSLKFLIGSVGLQVESFDSAGAFLQRKLPAFASAEEFLSSADRDGSACVILDVLLPGMSGLELRSQLTATVSNHRIPVVFITARDDEATRQRALKGGAVDLLRKPVRREGLLSAVHLALQQNNGQRVKSRRCGG